MKESWRNRLLVADDETVRRGYDRSRSCLFCEAHAASEATAQQHLTQAHGSVLDALLSLDKALTGLTDTQKALIRRWQGGVSDADIAKERGVSTSTLRNQRFALREREREARLLLAVLSLSGLSTLQKPQKAAKLANSGVDPFFRDGKLTHMPARYAKQYAVMQRFAVLFAPDRVYSDREVKELIAPIWADHALVRRFLCDAGMLRRTADGRSYWRESAPDADPHRSETSSQPPYADPSPAKPVRTPSNAANKEENPMPIDKKAAKQAYKNAITPMGIYRLLDAQSGRSVIAADRNLPSVMSRFRFVMMASAQQPGGPFSDPELYRDYRDHPDAFTFEVIESVDVEKCASYADAADALEALAKLARQTYAQVAQYAYK